MTSHDVAKLAGVSQPTVSRALRPDSQVSARTRLRVREAAEVLGYVPSERGRSLATRTTRQIAMVADIDNALYPHLIAPLHDALATRGYRMVLLAERGEEIAHDERLLDGSVDGAVLTTSQVNSALPAELARRAIPFVELNRVAGSAVSDSVTADNEAGGLMAAQILIDAGHRRIGALLGTDDTSSARDRERGLRAALHAAGIELPESQVMRGGFSESDGRAGVAALLERPGPFPSGIVCITDMVAVGAINAFVARGMAVPGQVGVVGFDDLPIASWPVFDLTTVRVDFQTMAGRAAELLLARVDGDTGPARREQVGVQAVLRSSHGASATS